MPLRTSLAGMAKNWPAIRTKVTHYDVTAEQLAMLEGEVARFLEQVKK